MAGLSPLPKAAVDGRNGSRDTPSGNSPMSQASAEKTPTSSSIRPTSLRSTMTSRSDNLRLSSRVHVKEVKDYEASSRISSLSQLEKARFEEERLQRASLMATAMRRSMQNPKTPSAQLRQTIQTLASSTDSRDSGDSKGSADGSHEDRMDRPTQLSSGSGIDTRESFDSQLPSRQTKTGRGDYKGVKGDEMMENIMDRSLALNPWLSWVDKEYSQGFIITVILLNMYALADETDHPQWSYWNALNGVFMVVYTTELTIRMFYMGPTRLLWLSHNRAVAWYDTCVLVIGWVDLIAAFLSHSGSELGFEDFSGERHQEMLLHEKQLADDRHSEKARRLMSATTLGVRTLQLSRLLRMPRIVNMIPDLFAFVKMLFDMIFGTIWWIFLVMGTFCFVLAIILTRLLGHGMIISESKKDTEEALKVQRMFADIPASLFTLFQLTTADDWCYIAQPVISMNDTALVRIIWRLFFIFFITFMCWVMLSLLTAVASETMISNTTSRKTDEVMKQEMERQGFITFLCEQFLAADDDNSGTLDKAEFQVLMTTPTIKSKMREHGIVLEDRDIENTWDTFDVDESGQLDINELVDGFALLQEGLATKHVASIGYSLKRFSLQLDQDMEYLGEGTSKLEAQQLQTLHRVQEQQKLYQDQWARYLHHQTKEAQEEIEKAEQEALAKEAEAAGNKGSDSLLTASSKDLDDSGMSMARASSAKDSRQTLTNRLKSTVTTASRTTQGSNGKRGTTVRGQAVSMAATRAGAAARQNKIL